MTYSELYSALDEMFPISLRAKWDNDGDMISIDKNAEIKKVLIALDVNAPTIERAIEGGFDLVISHHPLIFSPLRRINEDDVASKRVLALLRAGIRVMSFHTRLDCVAVNDELSKTLMLSDVETYEYDGMPMGRMGKLPESMTCKELSGYIKEKLSAPSVVFTDNTPCEKKIEKLALLGGGGCSAASSAKAAGADALLTGDYSYNPLIDYGESDFPIFAAGHFYTENPVCGFLEKTVRDLCPEAQTEIFNSNTLKTEL